MSDWADRKAAQIVDAPGILQVWHKVGYCRKCNQVLSGSAIDLAALKAAIADELRSASSGR
jgi:hypothetical protein